jgi:hypothetical protein
VRVGDADCPQPPKTPTGFSPGNLRTLAAIEERDLPGDPNGKAREPAVGQWQHPTRSQEHGINHRERAGTTEEATLKA